MSVVADVHLHVTDAEGHCTHPHCVDINRRAQAIVRVAKEKPILDIETAISACLIALVALADEAGIEGASLAAAVFTRWARGRDPEPGEGEKH